MNVYAAIEVEKEKQKVKKSIFINNKLKWFMHGPEIRIMASSY